MTLVKCPRCELNYIMDGGELCIVCRREIYGTTEKENVREMCAQCGERLSVPGDDLCGYCLKELHDNRLVDSEDDDDPDSDEGTLDLSSSVATMDEIELDLGDDMDDQLLGEEDSVKAI